MPREKKQTRFNTPEATAERAYRAKTKDMPHRRRRLIKWANPTAHDAYWFLKPRERKFVDNLMSGMAYKEAAAQAGFGTGSNYILLMRKPVVNAALYQKCKEHEALGDISTSQWLREISMLAFMPSGMLSGPPTWGDKLKALEMMGRYQKWLTDNKHVQIDIGISRLFGVATEAITKEMASIAKPAIEAEAVTVPETAPVNGHG